MYKSSFHNTIGYEGERKEKAEGRALSQDFLVFEFLRDNPMKALTPPEIHEAIPLLRNAPLTSVRRSLSNLVNKSKNGKITGGNVVKTNEKKQGKYGDDNHKWMYVPTNEQGQTKMF